MTWNKRQKATELRKRLDAEEFFTRDVSTESRGPVMLRTTRHGSTLNPVSVWTEIGHFTVFDRAGYEEYRTDDIDEIISRLNGFEW